jgi:hypothetical protein
VFVLDVRLDWKRFYEQKLEHDLIKYSIEGGQKRTYSPTGVPLLHLCI